MGILNGYLIMAVTRQPTVVNWGHGLNPKLYCLKEAARPTTQKHDGNLKPPPQNKVRIIKKGRSIIPEVMSPNRK
jgi:hypothetical protein